MCVQLRPPVAALVAAIISVSLSGCVRFQSDGGVDNAWRAAETPMFSIGETRQQQVLSALGPPSQIIDLEDGSVFYYLSEQRTGGGMIFIFYNDVRQKTVYDRAIFFFDRDGLLTDYALSEEAVERQ